MLNFKTILFLIEILRNIAIIILVILNYPATKRIIKKQMQSQVVNFHKNHIYNNYQLSVINFNEFESINKAMELIQEAPEEYINIPEEEVFLANFCISGLNNYKKYSINLFKVITILMTIELGISIGLTL